MQIEEHHNRLTGDVLDEDRKYFKQALGALGSVNDDLIRLAKILKPLIGGTEDEQQYELCKRVLQIDQAIYLAYQLPFDPRGKGIVTRLMNYEFGMGCKAIDPSELFVKVTRGDLRHRVRLFNHAKRGPEDLIVRLTFLTTPVQPNVPKAVIGGWLETQIFQQGPTNPALQPAGTRIGMSITEDNRQMVFADDLSENTTAYAGEELSPLSRYMSLDSKWFERAPADQVYSGPDLGGFSGNPLEEHEYFNKSASGKEADKQEQVMQEAQNDNNKNEMPTETGTTEQAMVAGLDHPTEFAGEAETKSETPKIEKRVGNPPARTTGFSSLADALMWVKSWVMEGQETQALTVILASARDLLIDVRATPEEIAHQIIHCESIEMGPNAHLNITFVPTKSEDAEGKPTPFATTYRLRIYHPSDMESKVVEYYFKIHPSGLMMMNVAQTHKWDIIVLERLVAGNKEPISVTVEFFLEMLKNRMEDQKAVTDIFSHILSMGTAEPSSKSGTQYGETRVKLSPFFRAGSHIVTGVNAWVEAKPGVHSAPRLNYLFKLTADDGGGGLPSLVYQPDCAKSFGLPGTILGPAPDGRRSHMQPWRIDSGFSGWMQSDLVAAQSGSMFVHPDSEARARVYGGHARAQYQPGANFHARPWYDLTEEQQALRKHVKPRNAHMKTDSFEMLRLFVEGANQVGIAEQEELRLFMSHLVDLDLKLRQFDRSVSYEVHLRLDGSPITEAIDPTANFLITVCSEDKQLTFFEAHTREQHRA